MSQTTEHYARYLAPVYAWMVGGADEAVRRGRQELLDLGLLDPPAVYAVDLGAGLGMHSIPLERNGSRVLAVDSSALLLGELRRHDPCAAITTVEDDLLNFPAYLHGVPDLVLCMGDTLTHLPDRTAVASLFSLVAEHLWASGRFVLTFRDYSRALDGTNRFVHVKSDASRILTCFLEYCDNTVQVHDILHELGSGGWSMRVSAYTKLRLAPQWVKAQLEDCGFVVDLTGGSSGMVRVNAALAEGVQAKRNRRRYATRPRSAVLECPPAS